MGFDISFEKFDQNKNISAEFKEKFKASLKFIVSAYATKIDAGGQKEVQRQLDARINNSAEELLTYLVTEYNKVNTRRSQSKSKRHENVSTFNEGSSFGEGEQKTINYAMFKSNLNSMAETVNKSYTINSKCEIQLHNTSFSSPLSMDSSDSLAPTSYFYDAYCAVKHTVCSISNYSPFK